MLIGVVGLIGSGKGTVSDRLVEQHGYQKDSFAKSLKDAVASMFNWDRNLLEGDTDAAGNGENSQMLSGVKNLASQQPQDGCCSTLARKSCVARCTTEYGWTVALVDTKDKTP